MKRIFTILTLLLICLAAPAQTMPTVTFNLGNMGITQPSNRAVLITKLSLMPPPPLLAIYDPTLTNSDSNGVFIVTNMMMGLYQVEVQGPPATTRFRIEVPTNANVALNAYALTAAAASSTFPAQSVAWSASASDARYVSPAAANAQFVSNPLTNTFNAAGFSLNNVGTVNAANIHSSSGLNSTGQAQFLGNTQNQVPMFVSGASAGGPATTNLAEWHDGNNVIQTWVNSNAVFAGNGSLLTGVTSTPSGSAGGALTGSYPNPGLAALTTNQMPSAVAFTNDSRALSLTNPANVIAGNGNGMTNIASTNIVGGYANMLWVSSSGNDVSGVRGSVMLPFKTFSAAKTAAQIGDNIHGLPGFYTDNNLGKAGITYTFEAGVMISNFCNDAVNNSWLPIFGDLGTGPLTNFYVYGMPNLVYHCGTNIPASFTNANAFSHPSSLGSSNSTAAVCFTNPATTAKLELGDVSIISGITGGGSSCLQVSNCNYVQISANELIDPLKIGAAPPLLYTNTITPFRLSTNASASTGIFWGVGDCKFTIGKIGRFGAYGFWGQENDDGTRHTNTCDVTCPWMQTKIYIATSATNDDIANSTYRSWFHLGWLDCSNSFAGAAVSVFGGYTYILGCDKISDTAPNITLIDLDGPAKLWLTGTGKMTAGLNGKYIHMAGLGGDTNGFPSLYGSISEFEDKGGVAIGLDFVAQNEVYLEGGKMAVTNGLGVVYRAGDGNGTNNGLVTLKGISIINANTATATNYTVIIQTNGLVLQNCTLVSPTGSESVFSSSAQSFINYGSHANKAKDANVTVQVDTLTVDANVK